jgi:SAM-dependent methyltransferase
MAWQEIEALRQRARPNLGRNVRVRPNGAMPQAAVEPLRPLLRPDHRAFALSRDAGRGCDRARPAARHARARRRVRNRGVGRAPRRQAPRHRTGGRRSVAVHAQAGARAAPWPASFTFVEGNIDDVLASDERGFDGIASVNVIWTLPDPQRTFARMTARLRDGGRMVHTTPSWRFRAHAIVWQHLRGHRGWARLRALGGLPVLALAGLLNLVLVAQSMLFARAPGASKRWHADGLAELLRSRRRAAQDNSAVLRGARPPACVREGSCRQTQALGGCQSRQTTCRLPALMEAPLEIRYAGVVIGRAQEVRTPTEMPCPSSFPCATPCPWARSCACARANRKPRCAWFAPSRAPMPPPVACRCVPLARPRKWRATSFRRPRPRQKLKPATPTPVVEVIWRGCARKARQPKPPIPTVLRRPASAAPAADRTPAPAPRSESRESRARGARIHSG